MCDNNCRRSKVNDKSYVI